MKIGYACIPLGIDARINRKFNIKNFSYDVFTSAVDSNLDDLLKILRYNIKNDIYMFRISSDIIPFASHPINNINWESIFKDKIEEIGRFITKNNIRVSMHPGQYSVLNSTDDSIVKKAMDDIEYHTKFLDTLNVDYSNKIVIHIGGVYGNKKSAEERFCTNYKSLSESASRRLIIENDEKCFNIEDILEISNSIGIPVVFDILHHSVNLPAEDDIYSILNRVKMTWKNEDGSMKLHYSEQAIGQKSGSHSKLLHCNQFMEYLNIVKEFCPDIMLEVKDKDVSAIKFNILFGKPSINKKNEQWAKYKYCVMEKDYAIYKKCSNIVKNDGSPMQFYSTVEEALDKEESIGNFKNAALHVFGYFKDSASELEKKHFLKLMEGDKNIYKAKEYLNKLALKYEERYILESYYFAY